MNTDSAILGGLIFLYKKWLLPLFGLLMRMFYYLRDIFLDSVYSKGILKIFAFFSKRFQNSGLYETLEKPSSDNVNIFSRVIGFTFSLLQKLFQRLFNAIDTVYKNSLIINVFSFIADNWHRINISCYGLFVFIFSGVNIAVSFVLRDGFSIPAAALSVLGFIMLFFNISVAEIIYLINDKILTDITGGQRTIAVRQHIFVTVAIVFGSALGIAFNFPMAGLVFTAALAAVFIIIKPRLGIYAVILAFPFVRTMQLVALIILLIIVYFVSIIKGEKPDLKISGIDCAVIGILLVFIFGVLNSYAVTNSLQVFMVYAAFVMFYFIFYKNINTEKSYYVLVDLLIYVGVIVSLYGIFQRITGTALNTWTDTEFFENIGGRVYSTFENPNVLGEYLLMLIPLSVARIYMHRQVVMKLSMIFSFVILTVCMVLTYSRGCWVGLMAALVIYFAFRFKKASAALIALVVFVPFVLPESVIVRFTSIGNMSDSSTSYRVYIWQGTMRMLKDFWITGVGLGEKAYNALYPLYSLDSIIAPHPHSLFLLILTQTGILGMLTILFLIWTFYKVIVKICKASSFHGYFAAALGVGMGGMLIQGIFDNVWYNYRVFLFFFIYIALVPALYKIVKKKEEIT